MATTQRREKLRAWIRTQPIITQSAWAREAGISRPTAIRDFQSLLEEGWTLEEFTQGSKVMGFIARQA